MARGAFDEGDGMRAELRMGEDEGVYELLHGVTSRGAVLLGLSKVEEKVSLDH